MTLNAHRPAVQWLTDLQKAKQEGMSGLKPKVTIQDLLEKVNDPTAPEQALIPSSPRSVEACFRLGIDPVELQFHPISHYRSAGDAAEELGKIRFDKCEAVRQERIKSLIDMRKRLIDDGWAGDARKPGTPGKSPGRGGRLDSTMVERERQRLEVLKKRQEKEITQMLAFEQQRKELAEKQQAKVEVLEARAKELQRQKEENQREWMSKQRDLELQKVQAEIALEKEAQRLASEHYRQEAELARKREEEEKRLKKEAQQRDLERRAKAEAARLELERSAAETAEKARLKKLAMEALDAERMRRQAAEQKEIAAKNMEKKKRADARIQSALTMSADILRKKREEFEKREEEVAARKAEAMERERREVEKRRLEEARKEKERQDKYLAAQAMEESRKKALRERAEVKERELAESSVARRRESDIRRVEKELELKKRLDRVDEMSKISLYQRQALLEKIMDEYDRTRGLLKERQALQEARKNANMSASLHRHKVSLAMDALRSAKDVSSMTGAGGPMARLMSSM